MLSNNFASAHWLPITFQSNLNDIQDGSNTYKLSYSNTKCTIKIASYIATY